MASCSAPPRPATTTASSAWSCASDPIRYEKMFSQAARRPGARPRDQEDCRLSDREQEASCATCTACRRRLRAHLTGIIIHVGTMGAAIKYMIENNWEANPGINPGDMFTNNDCDRQRAPCDIATIVPIFARQAGRLGRRRDARDRQRAVTPGSMSAARRSASATAT